MKNKLIGSIYVYSFICNVFINSYEVFEKLWLCLYAVVVTIKASCSWSSTSTVVVCFSISHIISIMGVSLRSSVVFIAVMVITNVIINAPHFKRDPAQTFLGITTNFFSPCIVIEEGSGFYKRSSIASSILHVICQIILFGLVVGEAISPCPNFEKNIFTPIMHCYPGNLNISTIARCDGDFLTSSDCKFDNKLNCIFAAKLLIILWLWCVIWM